MIKTVDNFIGIASKDKTSKQIEKLSLDGYVCEIVENYKNNLKISLKEYFQAKSSNNTLISFFRDEEKRDQKNEDDLIVSIKKTKNEKGKDIYLAQTGNYVGKFVWEGLTIEIQSRFSSIFLERMLNFANDIYLDDISVSGRKTKDLDISRYIIYYMFVQNLEKAFLLGLPKSYKSVRHHEIKLKGKIDIKRFIKNDIPFKGKISSTSREQKEIQEVIDVLYKAVRIIDKSKFSTKNISHIKAHLKQHRSNQYISSKVITKALKSKALQNPIFALYKKVLEYARYIINGSNIEKKSDGKNETYGFLINVAELFEIYIAKLLQKEFLDWSVSSPKEELYESQFYARKIIPDIVMEKDNNVLVFDTKYKRMKFRGTKKGFWDLDRNDFFQINTYMSYYQNHKENYKVVAGGLLYPMEGEFIEEDCHSDSWFGNNDTKFIVDGIELLKAKSMKSIVCREKRFIKRINNLMNKTQSCQNK